MDITCLLFTNQKDEFYREKGPAIIEVNGAIRYRFSNKPHRLDGTAVSFRGHKSYYIHGKKHSKKEYCADVKSI